MVIDLAEYRHIHLNHKADRLCTSSGCQIKRPWSAGNASKAFSTGAALGYKLEGARVSLADEVLWAQEEEVVHRVYGGQEWSSLQRKDRIF